MSPLRKSLIFIAKRAAEEFAKRVGEGIGSDLGKAVDEDVARSYRRWRGLPEQTIDTDDEKEAEEISE